MSRQNKSTCGLRAYSWKKFLRAPDAELVTELYEPALACAIHYDRCCAYFSSHVLAVAARGFGPFIKTLVDLGEKAPRPAARLIVNEQLEAEDMASLLSTGDQSKLIEKLLKQFKTPTDALACSRLQMLAWLVSTGLLEVKVGLMRHTRGVVHAKFGIVSDAAGNSISFMGSDNETGNALIENFETLQLATSWGELDSVEYYQGLFNQLWEDRDPQVTTITLPDAVKLKLIQFAPKSPPVDAPNATRASKDLSMIWHFLAATPFLEGGEHTSDATAMVEMWPHQRNVVNDTSIGYPAGRLLCDEVGMGKTLEAIVVLRRLLCGRGVERALILVPAGLLKQWQDELREKGGLLAPRWESGVLYHANGAKCNTEAAMALSANSILLVSREWARLENNIPTIMSAPPWDIVLLDEAHAARRSAPDEGAFNQANLLLNLLRELQLRRQARGTILLSATPMQTQPWEPWDLLQTLGIGDNWEVDFGEVRTYYDGIAALADGNSVHTAETKTVAKLVNADMEFPKRPAGVTGDVVTSLTFATRDKRPRLAEWLRCGSPLGRRMHRNTRDTLRNYFDKGLLDSPPPKRIVIDEIFDFESAGERKLYDSVAAYINDRYDSLEHQKAGKGFVMTVYRRRAASSPHALRKSLDRRLEGLVGVIRKQYQADWWTAAEVGIDPLDLSDIDSDARIDPALPTNPAEAEAESRRVRGLLSDLDGLGHTDSKYAKFTEVLQNITDDGRAALVFTEYTDTLEYLRDQLLPVYKETLGCYSGAGGQVWEKNDWHTVSKAEITLRLRQNKLRVLVCTDAASEGLNLQSASALINYDLPWNPSRVEQRIGRIDRIGQKQMELPIRNLFLEDSVDVRVYQTLRERCGLFEHFVGPMQPVLALARDALQHNIKPDQIGATIGELEVKAAQVQADHATASIFVSSEVVDSPIPVPPAGRADIIAAMKCTVGIKEIGITVTSVKGSNATWRISGLGKTSQFASCDREDLERDKTFVPLSLGIGIIESIIKKLPNLGSQSPLIIAEHKAGALRAVEARWIGGPTPQVVTTVDQLRHLLDSWDGKAPLPKAVLQAQTEARTIAKKRVDTMRIHIDHESEMGIQRQINSVVWRLQRELSRTLRCHGDGDLNALFAAQIKREPRETGRYHKSFELLKGFPNWTPDQISDAKTHVAKLSAGKRQSRITGTEIDAALGDPRWKAMKT